MIGVTKKVLAKMGLEQTPTEERLRWFMAKAEFLINSRPLVEVAVGEGAELAITPNDVLHARSGAKYEETRQLEDMMADQDDAVQMF